MNSEEKLNSEELMTLIADMSRFIYDNGESEMAKTLEAEHATTDMNECEYALSKAKMDGYSFALLDTSKMKLSDEDCHLNGKEITLAGTVLSVFGATYLFVKACTIIGRDLQEPTEFCADIAFVIRKHMESIYLTSAVDRKEAAMAVVKRIDEMNFSLPKVIHRNHRGRYGFNQLYLCSKACNQCESGRDSCACSRYYILSVKNGDSEESPFFFLSETAFSMIPGLGRCQKHFLKTIKKKGI